MQPDIPNPYQAPDTISLPKGQARFRLRRWFAFMIYLNLFGLYFALISDLFAGTKFGILPFLCSILALMMVLLAALVTRHHATIKLHDTRIEYRDLVQFVDASWDRVAGVIHKPKKTLIATDSRLVQISVSRRHEDYEAIVAKIDELQANFDFQVLNS